MKITIPFLDLEKMYNSGQQFTWNKIDNNKYSIIHKNNYLEISHIDKDEFEVSCSEDAFKSIWYSYFDLDTDYESLWIKGLVRGNEYLHNAVRYGWGIRILRQDPWEVIIMFLISQNNNMKRIRKSVDMLREKYGNITIYNDDNAHTHVYKTFPNTYLLETGYNQDQYKDCGLGYRDNYIKEIAEGWNDIIALLNEHKNDYKELIETLKLFKGTGNKVANCIALYGFHHLNAAPIDTHMKRIINEYFCGINPLDNFKGYEGIIQQWLFDYETNKNKSK